MTDKTPVINREDYIEYLLPYTNKTREYYEKLTDRELIVAYERLMKLD
jgi:hypothetical protein